MSTIAPAHLMTLQGTLLRRTQTGPPDEYGDPTWEEVGEPTVCELQQEVGYEASGGAVQLSTWRLFLPPTAPPTGWDAVQLAGSGAIYALEGDAWLARNPRTGADSHVEARVRRLS
jgi:hypothetical protein